MNLNLIKLYINKIKKEDINTFLNSNNIIVSNKELDYLYNILKNNCQKVLNEDKIIFNDIKNNINIENYNKLINLYNYYKEKYL